MGLLRGDVGGPAAAAAMLFHSRARDPLHRRAKAATVPFVIAMLPPGARAPHRPRPQTANPAAWESVPEP